MPGYSGEEKDIRLAFIEFTDECDQIYRPSVEYTCISKHIRPVFKTLLLLLLLLLLSRVSRVRLCATPETAALQAPPSLGFSRQGHWSGVPLASPEGVLNMTKVICKP